MFFQDAIVEFGFDCKVRKLSPKSITNYQKQLRYLQNYLEQEYCIKSVEQVRTAHIKMFLAMMDLRCWCLLRSLHLTLTLYFMLTMNQSFSLYSSFYHAF